MKEHQTKLWGILILTISIFILLSTNYAYATSYLTAPPQEIKTIEDAMQKLNATFEKAGGQVSKVEEGHQAVMEGGQIGGCLIATATYGSELAPQVQMLREIRDNTVLITQSGTSFMTVFNTLYYSFSPTIAEFELQNAVFKEVVKLAITPLITTLSILQYVDIYSEQEMIGYGMGIILLNIGMYFVAPAIVIYKLRNRK